MAVLDLFKLDGKRALVTGGGQGIGRGFALALAEAGAAVAVIDINPTTAAKVAAEIEARCRPALAVACDVTDPDDVRRAVEQVVERFGGLDIAVNNAGKVINAKAEEMSAEAWDDVLNLNLRAVFLCAREEGRVMIRQGAGGSIINTASMAASIIVHPQPQSSYNASKSAVVGLTRSLASEWAPHNIRVNCISPGYTLTELVRQEPIVHMHDYWKSLTPTARLGEVEELTGALIYLASAASSWMTGQELTVDGGYTIW